jgi:hypothetical protein
MLTCFLVVLLLIGEVVAVYRWRQRQFPRPRWVFSRWAPTIYGGLLLGAWVVGLVLSYLLAGLDQDAAGTHQIMLGLVIASAAALLVIVALTLFFNWVLKSDITDVPD